MSRKALLSQAQTAAQLRYQPALQALAALRSSKRSDYLEGLRQARTAAQIITAGNQEASGGLADFLTRIQAKAPTGPSQSEAQIVAQNLGLTGQAAGAQLANSTSRAVQGAVYQRQGLRKNYLSDVGQIDQQASNLADQYGTFVSDAYNKLVAANDEAAAKAHEGAANRRNQRVVAGVDANGNLLPGAKEKLNAKNQAAADKRREAQRKANAGRLPGGAKPVSTSAIQQAGNSIGYAESQAKRLKDLGYTTTEIRDLLTGGRQSTTVPIGDGKQKQTIPAIRPTNPLWVQVALERISSGAVSRKTAKRLHDNGYSLKKLGLTTKPDYAQVGQNVADAIKLPLES